MSSEKFFLRYLQENTPRKKICRNPVDNYLSIALGSRVNFSFFLGFWKLALGFELIFSVFSGFGLGFGG